jgi:hypothetical protein
MPSSRIKIYRVLFMMLELVNSMNPSLKSHLKFIIKIQIMESVEYKLIIVFGSRARKTKS